MDRRMDGWIDNLERDLPRTGAVAAVAACQKALSELCDSQPNAVELDKLHDHSISSPRPSTGNGFGRGARARCGWVGGAKGRAWTRKDAHGREKH